MALLAFLAAAGLSLAQLPAPSPEVTFVISGPPDVLQRVAAWRQLPGRAAEPIGVSTASGPSPGTVVARLPCVAADYIFFGADHVSLPVRLEFGTCVAGGTIALLPSATVRGRVTLPADVEGERPAPEPRAVAASETSKTVKPIVVLPMRLCSDTGRGEPLGEQRVEADEEGRFAILVPAGCVAVGIRVGRLAPVPPTPLFLSAGQVRDLGLVEMKRGATVSTTVTVRREPAAGVGVLALRADSLEAAATALMVQRTWAEAFGALSNSAGRVAIVGITSSPVHLVAAADGRVGISPGVELDDGEEIEADPLELRAPSQVEFAFVGDRNWINERLQVTGTLLTGDQGAAGVTLDCNTGEGATRVALPGRWKFDLRAGGLLLDTQVAEIAPEATTTVRLSVERFSFMGRVYLGDRPAAGSLSLSPADSSEVAARTQTGVDGRFTVLLREPGTYIARFSSEAWGVSGASATVQLAGDAETAIRFPDCELSGHVSFADGRAAADALVMVGRTSKRAGNGAVVFGDTGPTARTDASGRFALRGLEPGAYDVSARLGARQSDWRSVAVGEDGVQRVDMVLPDADGLTVSVTNRAGEPVAGLSGVLLAPSTDAAPQPATFQTDEEGLAKVAIVWTAGSRVHVVLTDPRFPVAAFRGVPSQDGTLAIALPAAAGQLRIALPARTPQRPDSDEFDAAVLIGEREAIVPLSLLTEMGLASIVPTRSATTVVIPALASGRWQLGRFSDVSSMLQAFSTGASPSVLRSFSVPAGGTAAVSVR